jgi:hypothetical protein
MNHNNYLRECLTAALIQQNQEVECLSDAIEFIEHGALLEITLGSAHQCGSTNAYVAHLRIRSTSEIDDFEEGDGEGIAYDHSLLWHASNYVGIRFRPYTDASPALALRLLDVANIAQVVTEIVTKYGPLGLVSCVEYATGDEIHLVEGTRSGVTMILDGQERGVTFTEEQRAFMLGNARGNRPYSIRDLWATPLTMLDMDSPMGQHAQVLPRSVLVEEFNAIYTNMPARDPALHVDEFDEVEEVLEGLESFITETLGPAFSATELVTKLGPLVICSDPLNTHQKEVAAVFGTKILSDLPLYVSTVFACFLGLKDEAYAAIKESNTTDTEALRVCNLFLSLYEEPWAAGSTEVREWIRIATEDNARELASFYVSSIIHNDSLDVIDAQARVIIARHVAANEAMVNVMDESFWTSSMHQLLDGPRFKMALNNIRHQDIRDGIGLFEATRDGNDTNDWAWAKASQKLFHADGVLTVRGLLDFAAAYVGARKNAWADYSAEILRHLPLSLVAALAVYNAVELSRKPDDVVKVHALRTYMDKVMDTYRDYMGSLLDYGVPQYPVNAEYIEEVATMMRSGTLDTEASVRDLIMNSAEHHGVDLLQRTLRDYSQITSRVKAHALIKSHAALGDIFDHSASTLTNRLGNISALFKSARVPADHSRLVDFLEAKLAMEFKGLLSLRSELRSMLWDTPTRSIYVLTAVLALSDLDDLEAFLSRASKSVRKDPTLRALARVLSSIREMVDVEQDSNGTQARAVADKHKEANPDEDSEPSTRGRPFTARLPKSEVATFMTAKASNCKQARKLSAMNIARAVYAEFGHDVSVFGYVDCNSFCRAISDKVEEVTVAEVLRHAAASCAVACDLEFDTLHSILRGVPLVVACTVYVADLLGVKLETIDATNKELKEDDEATKSAIFLSFVVNADFAQMDTDDADLVDDIVGTIKNELWPWGEDGAVDNPNYKGPAPSCIDKDPDEMTLEDLIAYVTYFKLLPEAEVVETRESDLRLLVVDHQDDRLSEEDEDLE